MNEATSGPAAGPSTAPIPSRPGLRPARATARTPPRKRAAGLRLLRALRLAATCAALALTSVTSLAAPAEGIVVEHFPGVSFADLREALADAIADEGLSAPVVSRFGAMLERTAPDLGHDPALYGDAEILSFCSAGVAARLVAEAREHIALCPLSIAVYSLPQTPRDATLAWRPPTLDSPGGDAVRALMARIVAGAARLVGRR
jgi:hypothetical protein